MKTLTQQHSNLSKSKIKQTRQLNSQAKDTGEGIVRKIKVKWNK